jgi:energy-coupling factor transporter ATP-binding protein EcfA2
MNEEEKLTKTVILKITPTEHSKLKEIARKKGLDISKIVRRAIRERIEDEEIAVELEKLGYPKEEIEKQSSGLGSKLSASEKARAVALMLKFNKDVKEIKKGVKTEV